MAIDKYDPSVIEPKWQKEWERSGLYKTPTPSSDHPKKYVLDMYPYPSGAVLHVGHMEGYVATDVYSRYLRMKGFSVLHPMGWDAFGLPAENYAIKTGINPDKSTHDNINTFRAQLKLLGLSYDWEREVDTSDPEYYKWTQWLFTVLFNKGLAYKKKAIANWCPKDETVLANEQVENGKCERCGTEVVQKELDQWFFKITTYADQLIEGLDKINWPQSTKLMQKNWIGRSEGVNFKHKVKDLGMEFEVYDSVPQTFMAQTFIVIAPEHPLVGKLVKGTEYERPVMEFVEKMKLKKTKEKFDTTKEKEGIFTGRYSENYMNSGRNLPIWVASFALMDYGTGIVGCSAHDERDFEFAKKYNIPLKVIMLPKDKELAKQVENLEYCYHHADDGVIQEPLEFKGMIWKETREPIIAYIEKKKLGRKVINYHLRDWLVSRQRYWGAPIPMVYCEKDGWQAVPLEDLPIKLPTDVDFLPHGESPIVRSGTFQEGAKCPVCGGPARREVDTMDTFVDSSWYFLRFLDPNNKKDFAGKDLIKEWMPVDTYVGGGHTVQHLLFARFFQKVMVDANLIDKNIEEPFTQLKVPGWILGPDNRKMSKRWGNVITPDDVVKQYGADTMRIYEMFIAPFEVDKPWNVNSVGGVRRFINRIYKIVGESILRQGRESDPTLQIALSKLVAKTEKDIENFRFNTAIAFMMEFLNLWEKSITGLSKDDLGTFLKILAPFAPHLTEELWSNLSKSTNLTKKPNSIHQQPWPKVDETNLTEETVTIIVSVNGKPRGEIKISTQNKEMLEKDRVIETARGLERVAKYLEGVEIKNTIYVQNKVVNFVV